MQSPKRIIQCLHDHWQVIEKLIEHSEKDSFSIRDLQTLIQHYNKSLTAEQVFKESQRFLNLEIVIPLARSEQLELNQAILEFGQYLLDEHGLGLASEISVLIDDMDRLNKKTITAFEQRDNYEVRRTLRRLDDRIRSVIKHFHHNEVAIANMVEQAKSDTSYIPLQKRYSSVLEAFDHYIEPMLDMLDIFGKFRQTTDSIEQSLSEMIYSTNTTGQLGQDKNTLLHLRTRILDLYQTGQNSLRRSTDILMPLRDELRKNTEITRGVSKLLNHIRKRGINEQINSALPNFASNAARHNLGLHSQIVSYLADVIELKDEDVVMPDEDELTPAFNTEVPEFNAVLQALPTEPVHDYLSWLQASYPDLAADETLYLLMQIADSREVSLNDQRTLQHYRLTSAANQSLDIATYSLGGKKI